MDDYSKGGVHETDGLLMGDNRKTDQLISSHYALLFTIPSIIIIITIIIIIQQL